jgi:DNA-binding transcriptional regulator PaaX
MQRKSDAIKIILKMIAAGVLIPAIFLCPGSAIPLKDFLNGKNIKSTDKNFKRMLKRAKEEKLVRVIQRRGDDFLEITKLGRKELLKYNIDDLEIKRPKIWDGKWRVVVFDIPEKFRYGRVALSRKLKEIGFYRLQKSVFVYPYECENEIDFIKEFFDVKKFVLLLYVSTMGEYYDLILKRHFDLLS